MGSRSVVRSGFILKLWQALIATGDERERGQDIDANFTDADKARFLVSLDARG